MISPKIACQNPTLGTPTTLELVKAIRKIAERLDINQLLVAQAKRASEVFENASKCFQKMGLAK